MLNHPTRFLSFMLALALAAQGLLGSVAIAQTNQGRTVGLGTNRQIQFALRVNF